MVARLLVAIEQGTAAAEHDAVVADLRAFDDGEEQQRCNTTNVA